MANNLKIISFISSCSLFIIISQTSYASEMFSDSMFPTISHLFNTIALLILLTFILVTDNFYKKKSKWFSTAIFAFIIVALPGSIYLLGWNIFIIIAVVK